MTESRPRILLIDDGLEYARLIETGLPELELLRPLGETQPPGLSNGPEALGYLDQHRAEVDLVLLDMRFDLPEEQLLSLGGGASKRRTQRFQGVAILRELRHRHPELPVVLLTAVADLSLVDADGELASQSMTYILDGDDLDTLRIRVRTALQDSAAGADDDEILWGRDRVMQALRRRLGVLARTTMPVLLEGETGTGKSFLAERYLHQHSGRRGPFVTLDLSAVPRDLVPAQLFGALKGAYTGATVDRQGAFQLAHGGTLFLDEVQNVPAEVQKQLLVVLQDRRIRPLGAAREQEVDVKVVAASNQSLVEAVRDGRFRQDLYMRLGPATRVLIPPLRERPADLPALTRALAQRAAEHPDNQPLKAEVARAMGLPASVSLVLQIGRRSAADEKADRSLVLRLPDPAWRQLRQHSWPGNMRELAMVVHNLVSFTLVAASDALRLGSELRGARLQVDTGLVGELLAGSMHLNRDTTGGEEDPDSFAVKLSPAATLNNVANDVERQYLSQLFQRSTGDFASMAATLLGDSSRARAVRLRFNQLGLKVRELRGS